MFEVSGCAHQLDFPKDIVQTLL